MERLLRRLADGRVGELADDLAALGRADPTLADVVAADAGVRAGTVGLPELTALRARVDAEAPERPLLRWWVLAALGERAFLDVDLGAIPLAAQALHELPDEPFVALDVLYVRGRLRRIASAVYLAVPSPGGTATHRELRDAAVADFMRGGFVAEAAVTRGLSAALHALATWDDVLEDLEVLQDARSLLDATAGSLWGPLLGYLHAQVAMTAGDLAAARTAIEAVAGAADRHPIFAAYADLARAEHRLLSSDGAAAVDDVLATLDRVRRRHPQILGLEQLRLAHLLADAGNLDAARTVGLAGAEWPPTNRAIALVGDLLRLRLDVLAGAERERADVLAPLDALVALGQPRRAAVNALRVARDFDRLGAAGAATAGALRQWGQSRLPGPRRRTRWEERLSTPLAAPGGTGGSVSPPAGVCVRVLSPVAEVVVDGRPVRLRDTPARLLLALLLAHPQPVHVEQAIDLLWPDATVEEGRPRLNTVVHRLRSAVAHGEAVSRTGDVLALHPDGWDVDLLALRSALRDDDAPALAAVLGAVTGNLCHVQFPYDDDLAGWRRTLAAEVARVVDTPTVLLAGFGA